MDEPLVFGFDVGTTAVKGLVFDLNGEEVFGEKLTYAGHSPRPGWMEQDPETWMDCIERIALAAGEEIDIRRIRGLGICSQVNTHVFVGGRGEALGPAITWQDQRCAEEARALTAQAEQRGMSTSIDASSLLSRAQWLKNNRPETWARTRWILSPKDYCIMKLTGQVASDGLSSVGLVDDAGEYDADTVALVEGLVKRLPDLRTITDIAGNCRLDSLPLSCPVVVGTMDAWASFYGSGMGRPGDGFQISGTSEIVGLLSARCRPTPGVVSFPPVDGLYLHAGPTQAGGDALNWLSFALDRSIDEIIAGATARAPLQEPLVFLPYLMGERAPLWDAAARGTFCGLSRRHTGDDMALAVFEGVAFSARHLLEELEKAAGFSCDRLRLSGGAAGIDLWSQIKADAMGRTLERVENINTGPFGAALMAMVGAGACNTIHDAMVQAVRIERTFVPERASREWYDDTYAVYRDAYSCLKPVFFSLSELQGRYSN